MEMLLHSIEETLLWQVLPVVERELGLPDTEIGYRFQADHEIINIRENRARVHTNALGMRDKQRSLSKPDGAKRIAIMGDSFTEALQVKLNDTFTAQTQAQLNRPAGSGQSANHYEVLNFGMSGFGPLQQLLHYKNTGIMFDPDLVVFVIGANDFLSQELSNDASGPAYVNTPNGELEIGYAYRNLTSHRLQQSYLGQAFFWAMDNSRIARAAYLNLKVGNQPGNAPRASLPGCKGIGQSLQAHTQLWTELQPDGAGTRLTKLLDDISMLNANANNTPMSFAIYGLLMPQPQCGPELATRAKLIATIESRLNGYNIALIDMEHGMAGFDYKRYIERGFHGFGVTLGHGHLNVAGHLAFANALTKHIKLHLD